MNNSDFELRQQAMRRAQDKISFYIHAMGYVLVNAGIVTVDLLTSPGILWFYWPLLGWGIGLLIHGIGTFGQDSGIARSMEEREFQKLKSQQNSTNSEDYKYRV